MNRLKTFLIVIALLLANQLSAQNKPADTVLVHVGESSKVILAIQDKKDLDILKRYNFQTLLSDLIKQLEDKDTTYRQKSNTAYLKDTVIQSTNTTSNQESDEQSLWEQPKKRNYSRRTYHSFNIDWGTNNFLKNGKFPDQTNEAYRVRPWGSWYVGLNSVQRTRLANRFFVEWGVGVSWYNFKFQNSSTILTKDNNGSTFSYDTRGFDYLKSKLTATYINVSLVPVLDFGRGGRKTTIFDGSRVDFSSRGNHSNSFRIGAGPYAGYRLDSYTKLIYKDQGDRKKEGNHDSFYLNNLRYGIRFQFGYDDIDFFFNYDLNNVFADNKGPKLNAFSFGITF